MAQDVPETDWKVFRELREVAIERYCKRILDEVERFRADASRSHHERYLALYRWLRDRNEDLAHAFDDPRRSQMLWQLAAIHAHGLLESNELAQFTAKTRKTIESLATNAPR
jgi:hypothetical protein